MSRGNYRQIIVGGRPASIRGLDEIFDVLYEQGHQPDDSGLGAALIEQARQRHNYIPKPAVDDFAQAMAGEYRRYVEQRLCGCKPKPVDYGTWRGHPREQVPWFPTVALDLCDGCGACLKFCSFGVFETAEDGKIVVAEPFKCQVGCSSCVRVCRPKAITFPPRNILEAFRPGDGLALLAS
jgi:NAD-dependent dihydropyrimidine dehydrogenase PreA subunit